MGDTYLGRRKGCHDASNLCEFFFVVTRKVAKPLSHAQAQAVLSGILAGSQWAVLDRNPKTVLKAVDLVKLHRTSIWDALIAASMLENNVSKILTENERDFRRISSITVINPFKSHA